MVGGAAADVLSGGEGDDILLGGEAGDTLMGGSGSDLVKGDGGSDVIFGGSGGDVLFGGGGADLVLGEEGDDRLFGDEGDDVLEGGAGSDVVYGGSGDDRFIARQGDGDDIFWGESGADTLDYAAITAHLSIDLGNGSLQHGSVVSSQSGFDAIFGFENVIGGAGDDTIVASAAVNVIDGGGGNDSFVFRSAADGDGDVIRGFAHGDRIDLSGMAGPAGFTLATASLTGAGQVLVTHVSGDDGEALTRIQGNVSGGDGADFHPRRRGSPQPDPVRLHGVLSASGGGLGPPPPPLPIIASICGDDSHEHSKTPPARQPDEPVGADRQLSRPRPLPLRPVGHHQRAGADRLVLHAAGL